MTPAFPHVTNNIEKYETYKSQMERLNLAKEKGFNFEGIFILYAMLEDRLLSFLYHAGVVNGSRDKLTKNKTVRPYLEEALASLGDKKYRIKSIGNKILIIQHLISHSQTYTPNKPPLNFHDHLCTQIHKTKNWDNMNELLKTIQDWCKSRNELVHALLSKSVSNQEEKLVFLIGEGYRSCRQLDNFVRSFKRGNTIRKYFNIQ